MRQDIIFLAHFLFRPLDRYLVIAGVAVHPLLIDAGPFAQGLLAHHRNTDNPAKEVHNLLGPRQAAQIAMNDNAIETVVNKGQHGAEQRDEQIHRTLREVKHAP